MATPRESLRVIIAASEAVPFSKTGGLADVAGALAKSLDHLGHDVTLFLPDYYHLRQNNSSLPPIADTGLRFSVPMNGRVVLGTLNWTTLPDSNVRVLLVRQPEYFDRRQLYQEHGHAYVDNCERFAYFSRAVMEISRQMILRPDVIHCNDWQTGIINGLLQTQYNGRPGFERTASVMTPHNMAYQGRFWHFDMPLTGMDWKHFNHNQMEAWGDLNLLKTGIAFADQITTVSPTYATEICTSEGGYGLEELLTSRRDDLVGILNGIDDDVWNPATDQHLPAHYSIDTVADGKPQCKTHLQRRMHLEERADVPILGMVSRMADQKGFDLITGAAERILAQDLQLVFLGTGDPFYEGQLRELAGRYPGKVAAEIGFDESLAHQIEAGADMFLMPSRFEPCGLNQMYSLIVRNVGGLADSVENFESESESLSVATGFVFVDYSKELLAETIEKAVAFYRMPDVWKQIVRNGMSRDWSWKRSAQEYVSVYRKAMERRQRRSP
jgi:starch synthase